MKPLMKTFTAPDGTEYEVCDEVARSNTPAKGVDYFTEADKEEFQADMEAVRYSAQTLTNEQKSQARDNINAAENQNAELSEIWAAISALQNKTMVYPKLASGKQWYTFSGIGNTLLNTATSISFVDSYTPTGNEAKSWACDVDKTGSIMGYWVNNKVIVAGNGSGKIRLNETCGTMFKGFKAVTALEGFDILDASEAPKFNDMFSGMTAIKHIDLSMLKTPNLINANYAFEGNPSLETVRLPQYGMPLTTTKYMFSNCPKLKEVDFGRGAIAITDYAFHKCTNLEKVEGLNDVTTVGDYAFCYTPKVITDLKPEHITSIGISAFRLSGVEDKSDMSVVPLDAVGDRSTRHKRWSADKLSAIRAVSVPDVYIPVPYSAYQKTNTNIFCKVDDSTPATFADYGCTAYALYHIWQALHPDTPYTDFMTWFNAEVDYVEDDKFADMYFGEAVLQKEVERLGWKYESDLQKIPAESAEQKQIIANRLREGKPTWCSIGSANRDDGIHAVVVIGADSETGKFAIIDSGVCAPSGVVSWLAYEDIFAFDGGSMDSIRPLEYEP